MSDVIFIMVLSRLSERPIDYTYNCIFYFIALSPPNREIAKMDDVVPKKAPLLMYILNEMLVPPGGICHCVST